MAPASAVSPAKGTSGGAHEPPRGISLPSAQAAARRLVCERQCAYHKPEKIFEEPCAAFILLAGQRGLLAPDGLAARFSPRGKEPSPNVNENDPRLLVVCALCSFPPDGCDFRSPRFLKPTGACEPCGGLRVLAGLLDAGVDFANPFPP